MTESISKYLAEIGRKGGQNSRRDNISERIREMTAIREMKRAAARKGDMVTARKPLKLKGPKTEVARKNVPAIKRRSFPAFALKICAVRSDRTVAYVVRNVPA